MESVLTLIATPPLALKGGIIDMARTLLEEKGAKTGEIIWLSEGIAADIPFEGANPAEIVKAIEAALGTEKVDAIVQSSATRRKKLLLADMESTIIEQELLDELARYVGLHDQVAAITASGMRGELDFAQSLKARVALLKGLPVSALEAAQQKITLMPGAETLIKTLRQNNIPCYLISGGFRYFTQPIAQRLGFTSDRANELIIMEGKLTGEVRTPILGKEAKHAALTELASAYNVALSETMSVGDGANDLPMLLASGLGVAFRAKPKVAEAAQARVTHSDLTALLYMQGYRQADFI